MINYVQLDCKFSSEYSIFPSHKTKAEEEAEVKNEQEEKYKRLKRLEEEKLREQERRGDVAGRSS